VFTRWQRADQAVIVGILETWLVYPVGSSGWFSETVGLAAAG